MHVESSILQFKRAEQVSSQVQDKKRASIVYSHKEQAESVVDTMGTAVNNFTSTLLSLSKDLKTKADSLGSDLIEPLSMYQKNYQAQNRGLLDSCNEIWTALNMERTKMLFAKENYYNQMFQLTQL